jgi:protein-disulfide isomerase
MRLYRFIVPALAGLALLGAGCGQPKLKPTDPVAKVGNSVITAAELDAQVGGQVYELKKQALEGMIRDRLLEDKAKAENVPDTDALLQKAIPEPADAELQALYEQAKASGRELPPFDQIKPQIAQYVKQQKAQQYIETLRTSAQVKITLPPYRTEVQAVGPSKGKSGAPITIVEFSDYQCPFCAKAEPTVDQVLAAYPDKIRLVYRDYPLPIHPLAPKAAEACHCAEDQGKYWEMHAKMFQANGALEVTSLKKLAGEVGLDQGKFDKCLDSGEKAKLVAENFKAGKKAGVNGTPAFFINGRLISGAMPVEEFKKVIDAELAEK